MRTSLFVVLVLALTVTFAYAQQCPQQRGQPSPPVVLRFVAQRPPAIGPNASLLDISLNTEYTMRNTCTGSCAYAAVRNADVIRQQLGQNARIYVTIDPTGQRGAHATAEHGGTHLNRGRLNTLGQVLLERGPQGAVYQQPFDRAGYVLWELQQNGRNVTRVPLSSRLWNNGIAGYSIAGGFGGGMVGGVAGDQIATYYDVDPVYRVVLRQGGGYLGSSAGSAAASRSVQLLGLSPKLPTSALGGAAVGGATTGLGVHATMWHDVIEPEASNAMCQMRSADRQPVPSFRYVSDGGANLRRELRERAAEAEYYQCISRFFGLGIYFCSYPKHWK
jgi:hypothetical protein